MKEVKPLKLEEMTLEQKIGFLMVIRFGSHPRTRTRTRPDDEAFCREMIQARRLGAVQVYGAPGCEDTIRELRELADYPLLVCADMEQGYQVSPYAIPSQMGLSITNDEELAYQFGAVTAIEAKRAGYSMIWGPVVDLLSEVSRIHVGRRFSDDKEQVARMAAAVVRGFQDNGIVATAKHWATPYDISRDGHLFKNFSQLTEKDLRETVFYPYRYAMEHAGLGAIMTGHTTFVNIDEYPGTISKKVVSIAREEGFDGLMITDSMGMSGILQKVSFDEMYGMAVQAGNDFVLPAEKLMSYRETYDNLMRAYKNGMFSEERLNDAVRHILKAQELGMKPATATEVSEYQKECFTRISQQSVCDVVDEGVSHSLNKESKKLFVVLVENPYTGADGGTTEIADRSVIEGEHFPAIKEMILQKFPDANVDLMNRFPSSTQMARVSFAGVVADEVIFITNVVSRAFGGSENLTEPITTLMESMQEKISAVIHIGNPFAMERIPHVPRVIMSVGGGVKAIENGLSILNGEYIPKGKLPVHLSLA